MKCWATPAAIRIAIQTGFIQRPHAVSSISAESAGEDDDEDAERRRTTPARRRPMPVELAPEREVADDGEPERQPERDRPRRARPAQESVPAGARAARGDGGGSINSA